MKRRLLVSSIICALAFSFSGCGKSPDNQQAATGQPARETGRAVAPEAEKSTVPSATPAQAIPSASAVSAKDSGAMADVIEMRNTSAFSVHTREIVMFDHKKHIVPQPEGYGLACGECHHDENGLPLKLEIGDAVQGCMECHEKAERPRKPKGMTREEWDAMQLEYYYGAIHANCIDCHTETQAGPVKCIECHPKSLNTATP